MHTERRDGIQYTIDVTEEGARYRAVWNCPVCGVSGKILEAVESVASAVLRAKAHLFSDHHVEKHFARRNRKA